MIDGGFLIGFGVGALAILAPWIYGPYRKYVLNCGKAAGCPHHSPENAQRLNDTNDQARRGPPRPPIS